MSNNPDNRSSAAKRGYGKRWQKAREQFLAENPLCVFCQARGLVRAATVVDHKIPHKGDMKLFWRRSNWQALCKPCHDIDKQRLERGGALPGCTADGIPLDPSHHWS
ncbi:HNH endonuclease [Alcanivoracaceae bacterium MT1]